MKKLFYLFLTFVFFCIGDARGQVINDHIFPVSAAAKSYIDFDSKGFLVNGKRTFIVSAGLEYARIPHQLWFDRLLRIKQAGFNCVEIYTIWNFHEAKEGKFNFAGDHDLNAFLTIVKNLGMSAIVRVGPYFCAEWDNGGYPIWLKFKKGLHVREHNPVFEKYVDRFFDKVLPIVMKNQICSGGSVIMVQLENEHPKGWGTAIPDDYFKYLQQKGLRSGLLVPYFFSGLHHESDPAGNGNLDDKTRPNPWFSTEFWSVWYSQYGAKPTDAAVYDRRTWKIIANGGGGYNYYMAHGGSNFGYTNNDEDAASYDYGAAIGQTGDLRPLYYTFKRAAFFARSFQNILSNSTNNNAFYQTAVTDTAIKVTARNSPAGEVIFLNNTCKKQVTTTLSVDKKVDRKPILLLPGEIYPVVHHFKLNNEVAIEQASTRIFSIVKEASASIIILEAEKGQPVSISFITQGKVSTKNPELSVKNNQVNLDLSMPAITKPLEFTFKTTLNTVRILVMDRKWTDITFISEVAGHSYIFSGASYIGKVKVKGNQVFAEMESLLQSGFPAQVYFYTDQKSGTFTNSNATISHQPKSIFLGKWMIKKASDFSVFNRSKQWLSTKNPQPMGADGDVTADAWYKTQLNVPATGSYTLQVKGDGRGEVFVDGKAAIRWLLNKNELTLELKKGKHQLCVFAAHDGRDKLAAYLGPIDQVDNKGVFGQAVIKKGGPFISEIANWYFIKAEKNIDKNSMPPKFDTVIYKKYKIGDDAFNQREGYGWFSTTIPKQRPDVAKLTLQFKSVDEDATVFINGKKVWEHKGWNQPFEVVITDTTVLKSAISLSVFIANHDKEGGIDQPVMLNAIGHAQPINGWKMKGGPGSPDAINGWSTFSAQKQVDGPCFYRTFFSVPASSGQTFIWRFNPAGLSYGSVWVNGHNIGRYPEKNGISSLYIPECWLKKGLNKLVVFDEEGKQPKQTNIVAEIVASRKTRILSAKINY